MANAINYFLNEYRSLANDNCRLYYDFNHTGNTTTQIIPNQSGNSQLTGYILPSTNNFWSAVSGSGYFYNNRYVKIANFSGNEFDPINFTLSLVYENFGTGGSTLISTIDTGNINMYDSFGTLSIYKQYKGFEFGITANNQLYFEYYTNNGPNIFTSDFSLADKSSVFLNIIDNEISIGYYNFFKNKLITNTFYIQSEYLFNYSGFYIGYNPNAVNGYSFNKNFTGFIDNLLIFSPAIYEYDLVYLNSGFAYEYVDNSSTISEIFTGITGYVNQITGYITQVTGYAAIPTGVVTNEWGVEYTGYLQSGLSGTFPLYAPSGLTGIINLFSTGSGSSIIAYNTNYVSTFNKNYINILSKLDSQDLIEANLITQYNQNFSQNLNFNYQNYQNSFFLDSDTTLNEKYIVYANGQLQNIGDFYITGDGYNSGKYIINDYIIEDNTLKFSNTYTQEDNIIADYIDSDIDSSIYNFKQILTGVRENSNEGFYGYSNAINNNEKIIIMGGLGSASAASGGALIFTGDYTNGWAFKQKLTGDSSYDRFGISVVTRSGDIILVGAYNDGANISGSCFIFTGNSNIGWTFKQKLTGDSINNSSNGNYNVINNNGTVLLMSSYLNDSPFTNCGGAFIYTGNSTLGWNFKQKLTGSFAELSLGYSAAMNGAGDIIALGGYSAIFTSGLFNIYTGNSINGWNLKQSITGLQNQNLGSSISITNNGNIILVGAKGGGATDLGSGLIYTGNSNAGWQLKQIITGDVTGNYGQSVSITDDGNTILIHGKIYPNQMVLIYTGNSTSGWNFKQKIIQSTTSETTPNAPQNTIISPSGNMVIIGNSRNFANTGSSFIYNLDNNNLYTVKEDFIINSGSGFYILTGYDNNYYSVYFNGQKLTSGLHYNSNLSNYIQFNKNSYYYTGVSGKLSIIKNLTDFIITGTGNLFTKLSPYFSSEIYKNGIRQKLSVDYLELAKIDSNNGTGFFDIKPDLIYNNEGLFNL